LALIKLNPKSSLNKAFLKVKPNRDEIEKFKSHLIDLLDKINESESEEFHKNLISDFLKKTYYDPSYYINTKGRNDLVIHNGKEAKDTVAVIVEAKKPTNKAEMLKQDNLNTKAFQELVLYFLRERITHKNHEVKCLVATNINEWFIFDASVFEKHFAHDKSLVAKFIDFEAGRLSGDTTDFFYKEIAQPAIAAITSDIEFTYFDIRDYDKPLRNENKQDDNKLISLFKLLSPEHLLKLPFINDSNSLDKRFYSELLHIIGLNETKDGTKILIQRKNAGERDAGSLLENAIDQIDSMDKLSRFDNVSQFGVNKEERLFNIGLELVITWVNRILFLKLLEAQLLTYHKGDNSYSFLNHQKIGNFDDLNSLFFQVLARKNNERNDDAKKVFSKVPYLNSSLFEPTEIEHTTLFISNLRDEKKIPVLPSTVLKDANGKKKKGELTTLEYLFQFLDAYDFASEGAEEIQEENKSLINASVLGLIFEKINGYKDGSFFTPGFITMYMSREAIRRAVIQKFNEVKTWQCKSIDDLYDKIEDRKEANEIINSLKICDPAVGSGHFLVSALNELITIKNDLKILLDRKGSRLKEYQVEVVNDELIVMDEDGEFFEYKPSNPESQRIQEALFHEKQVIIENCLFGVDINPNSVKICRLRLWIELLKNAYYKNSEELETLPNIDINIKCGNSLISRFTLDSDLKEALKKAKISISSYKSAVDTYRNANSKEQKREMEKLIDDIKNNFRIEIYSNDPKVKKLTKSKNELDYLSAQTSLFEESVQEKKIRKQKLIKLQNEVKSLSEEIEQIKSNKVYENAFEWRFEFPEVLNDEGDYQGFDLVIGNPPYIAIEDFSESQRTYFKSKYTQFERKYESSVLFIVQAERILKANALLTYIAPQTWLTGENFTKFRSYIFSDLSVNKIINLPFNIFEDAYVDTSIYVFKKTVKTDYEIFNFNKKDKITSLENIIFVKIDSDLIQSPDYKIILDKSAAELIKTLNNSNFISLGEITKSTQGLAGSSYKSVGSSEGSQIYPFLNRGNVYNYKLVKEDVFNISLEDKPSLKQFYQNEPKVLIRRIINRQDRLSVGYCDESLVFKKDINPFICTDDRFDTLYLLGILASQFISSLYLKLSAIASKDDFRQTTLGELRKLPIPIISKEYQKEISVLVEQILENKKAEIETQELEDSVEKIVCRLYGCGIDLGV
jgi:adenine-specific DNA-methyltransferase